MYTMINELFDAEYEKCQSKMDHENNVVMTLFKICVYVFAVFIILISYIRVQHFFDVKADFLTYFHLLFMLSFFIVLVAALLFNSNTLISELVLCAFITVVGCMLFYTQILMRNE